MRRQPVIDRLRQAGCVFAEDEADVLLATGAGASALDALVARRTGGEPLEQIVGWALFCGQRMHVEPGVFVPRRRTEFLVTCALEMCVAGSVVVELCCGCGAVATALVTALAVTMPGVELHASDIDPAAVRCARRNLAGRGTVHTGDLYDALPERLRGNVDVLVVNAPYVPTGEIALMPTEARVHEPRAALDGGSDGLDLHRRIAAGAPAWLAPGGRVVVETSVRQAPLTAAILAAAGLAASVRHCAALDATAVLARRQPARTVRPRPSSP